MGPAAPQVQRRGNALLLQERGDRARFVRVRVLVAGRDDDLRGTQWCKVPLVAEAREEGERVHEVALAIPTSVEPAGGIEGAGEADDLPGDLRMPERHDGGMERAERGADQAAVLVRIRLADRGDQLVEHVTFVIEVAPGAVLRRLAVVVEGLPVDAVDAPELQVPRVDAALQMRDHPEVLPLVERAHRGREDDHRHASLAEDEQLHRPAERPALPGAVHALHARARFRAASIAFHAACEPRQPSSEGWSPSSVLYVA